MMCALLSLAVRASEEKKGLLTGFPKDGIGTKDSVVLRLMKTVYSHYAKCLERLCEIRASVWQNEQER